MSLIFITNKKIDKQRWDKCVEEALNGLIYARSFYLDSLCPQWSALTNENYDWIFPITSKRKFGFKYMYQPPFTQQLGLFAKRGILVPYNDIIQWLKQHYSFWEVNWNYENNIRIVDAGISITSATNYILNLASGYENIARNYHNVFVKNLKRSKRFGLRYHVSSDYKKAIAYFIKFYGNKVNHVKESDYKNFNNLCAIALSKQMLVVREAINDEGELMAIALLLDDGKRLYNLLNPSTPAGKKAEANYFLLDSVIKEFSGKNILFDFEGSDLPGVNSFYKSFGATNQPYPMLKYNKLPWPLRMFKK